MYSSYSLNKYIGRKLKKKYSYVFYFMSYFLNISYFEKVTQHMGGEESTVRYKEEGRGPKLSKKA